MIERKLLDWEKDKMKFLPVNFKFVKTTIKNNDVKFSLLEKVIKSNSLHTKQLPVTLYFKPISRLI